jgi:hypothetical protein
MSVLAVNSLKLPLATPRTAVTDFAHVFSLLFRDPDELEVAARLAGDPGPAGAIPVL